MRLWVLPLSYCYLSVLVCSWHSCPSSTTFISLSTPFCLIIHLCSAMYRRHYVQWKFHKRCWLMCMYWSPSFPENTIHCNSGYSHSCGKPAVFYHRRSHAKHYPVVMHVCWRSTGSLVVIIWAAHIRPLHVHAVTFSCWLVFSALCLVCNVMNTFWQLILTQYAHYHTFT